MPKPTELRGTRHPHMRSGAENTGRKIPEETPPNHHITHLRKLGKHMYHIVDGNLILQRKNTRDVKKKATPVDKQKQTIEKDLGIPNVLGLVDKECQSIN